MNKFIRFADLVKKSFVDFLKREYLGRILKAGKVDWWEFFLVNSALIIFGIALVGTIYVFALEVGGWR